MVGVADRSIEFGQFVHAAYYRSGDRLDQFPRRALIEVHGTS
jgi:hypothetical protein